MIRRTSILFFSLILFCSFISIQAGRKRSKSGKIDNNTFSDKVYDFTISIEDDWDGKIQKEDSDCRLEIRNTKLKEGRLFTDALGVDGFQLSVPLISVWVIETKLLAEDYLKDFLNDPLSTKVNEGIISSIQASWAVMYFDRFKTAGFTKITIDNHEGVNWVGSFWSRYKSMNAELTYHLYGIFDCVQFDDTHILFLAGRTEPTHFNEVGFQMKEIAHSVKFINEKK